MEIDSVFRNLEFRGETSIPDKKKSQKKKVRGRGKDAASSRKCTPIPLPQRMHVSLARRASDRGRWYAQQKAMF